jgi:hypothetical protein
VLPVASLYVNSREFNHVCQEEVLITQGAHPMRVTHIRLLHTSMALAHWVRSATIAS